MQYIAVHHQHAPRKTKDMPFSRHNNKRSTVASDVRHLTIEAGKATDPGVFWILHDHAVDAECEYSEDRTFLLDRYTKGHLYFLKATSTQEECEHFIDLEALAASLNCRKGMMFLPAFAVVDDEKTCLMMWVRPDIRECGLGSSFVRQLGIKHTTRGRNGSGWFWKHHGITREAHPLSKEAPSESSEGLKDERDGAYEEADLPVACSAVSDADAHEEGSVVESHQDEAEDRPPKRMRPEKTASHRVESTGRGRSGSARGRGGGYGRGRSTRAPQQSEYKKCARPWVDQEPRRLPMDRPPSRQFYEPRYEYPRYEYPRYEYARAYAGVDEYYDADEGHGMYSRRRPGYY